VISSDASPLYAFSLPFVAHAWSKIVGARPLVILVGNEFKRSSREMFPWTGPLLAQLKRLGIKFVILDHMSASPATFSQLVRLYAFKLPFVNADDYVVASDRY
jgi:hypothetical protein